MTITTEMLLAAGCRIVPDMTSKRRCAFCLNDVTVAYSDDGGEWKSLEHMRIRKHRFRVKAKSVKDYRTYDEYRALAYGEREAMWAQTVTTNEAGRVTWPQRCRC